jgi:hypothetical protein
MNAFAWIEFLNLAIALSKSSDEASLRTAVSRAYYSVFHAAHGRPAVNQYRFDEDENSHDRLWSLYARNTDNDCKEVALLGSRMKKRRVQADYRSFYPRLEAELVGVLEDAQKCIAILSALDPKYPEPVSRSWSYGPKKV